MVKRLAQDPTAKKHRAGRETVDYSPDLVSPSLFMPFWPKQRKRELIFSVTSFVCVIQHNSQVRKPAMQI